VLASDRDPWTPIGETRELFERAAAPIHALMHVDNVSRSRSALHGGVIFRRYALMGLRL
jgi:hypothetical protein